jgi:transcriptional regulator with XRE-family HTH domain
MSTDGTTAESSRASASGTSPDGIGTQLRIARFRLGLTLREVEERTFLLGQKWGNATYRISASWLDRVERENRGLSATKLIVLAFIYNLTTQQMLSLCPGASDASAQLAPIPSPNSTVLLEQGPLEQHARLWLPDKLVSAPPPENTMLLQTEQGVLPTNLRRGVIGRRDKTMEPMILAGSIVLVDTLKRAIASRKAWTTEFDRPIYFLLTRTGYCCGFCELDRQSEWLTLVPHMLSPEPKDRRWRYRKEVEVVGTVTGLFTRRIA